MSNRNSKIDVIRSAGGVGLATFISRILGFVRDVLIARFFGTGIAAEAFVVAFRIPNLLRSFVGEGAANAALVPIFSEYLIKDKAKLNNLITTVFYLMFFAISSLVVLGIIFSPFIIKIIAPGFSANIDKLNLTINLTRFMFPYLLLIALTAFFISILHAYRSFVIPAFGPCLLNISFIAMILLFRNSFRQPIYSLAVAVILGGALQLIMHIPVLSRKGIKGSYFNIRNLEIRHPGLVKVRKMFLPRALSAGVYHINIFVDTICSSLSTIVGEGAIAAIYYANRIVQFPLSIFAISLSSVMLPNMSRNVAEGDTDGLRRNLSFSIKGILLIMLPISVGVFLLAFPLTKMLFERGEFSSYSTHITSWALLFYSLGLVFYAGAGILRNGFYALHDTMTPVKISGICVLINVVLNVILMFPLKVGGIALASSISALINFSLLYAILKKRIGGLGAFNMKEYILKITLAALAMGIFTSFLWQGNFLVAIPIAKLIVTIISSAVIFGGLCVLIKIKELNKIIKWILRR